MIWLLLSILCSTIIFVVFKYFDRFGVDNLQAIIVNYIIACTIGMSLRGFDTSLLSLPTYSWFPNAVILSFLFIWLFQLMALGSQKIGVSVVSIAVKMSLAIPVAFAIFYHNDGFSLLKALGIVLAMVSVYLASQKKEGGKFDKRQLKIPLFLFLGSGFLDTFLKYNQEKHVPTEEHGLFSATIFGLAALLGTILLTYRSKKGKVKLHPRNIVAGIVLGIPNYGSIYFLLRALQHNNVESSVIFPLNNVGVVALSVVSGALLFKEKLSLNNKIGIVLAITSITLIAFENFY